MRIVRLAHLLEKKYGLEAVAGSKELEHRVNAVRQDILDAYNNYINIESRELKPAYNIIPLLSEMGEQYSKQITALMEDLINDIDTIDLHDLFGKVQNVLAVIDELQHGKKAAVRNSIHDMYVKRRDTDVNRREMAKSKFENVVFKKLASILKKAAKSLNILLGKTTEIIGGPTEPEVKEPTKEEQNMFRLTQLAALHHLDKGPIFGQVWLQPDLKRRLIRLINKGKNRWAALHLDPEVMKETSAIVDELNRRQTNEGYFDAGEDAAKEMGRPKFMPPGTTREQGAQQALKEKDKLEEEKRMHGGLSRNEYIMKMYKEQEERQKEQALKEREIEEDRERLIKSEGKMDVLIERLTKRYL